MKKKKKQTPAKNNILTSIFAERNAAYKLKEKKKKR